MFKLFNNTSTFIEIKPDKAPEFTLLSDRWSSGLADDEMTPRIQQMINKGILRVGHPMHEGGVRVDVKKVVPPQEDGSKKKNETRGGGSK